ncbi:MAG TPA: SMP-30/gluconolactonase/LRE family protein [Microvirga sp.]|jgi:sugar lactone lactonase YvrE
MTVDILVPARNSVGESPVWCPETQALWWIDVRAPALFRYRWPSGPVERWPMPAVIGCVALAAGDQVIVALATGLHRFDPQTGALMVLCNPETRAGFRYNDGRAAPDGSLWLGSMPDPAGPNTGRLWHLAPGGGARVMAEGIRVPNAIAFSSDGTRRYHADTAAGAILVTEGEATRLFAPLEAAPGRPDGAVTDAADRLWNARWGGAALACFTPAGALDALIHLPARQPTSCCFAGPDLDHLVVTTARIRLEDPTEADGALLVLQPGICGWAEPRCAL